MIWRASAGSHKGPLASLRATMVIRPILPYSAENREPANTWGQGCPIDRLISRIYHGASQPLYLTPRLRHLAADDKNAAVAVTALAHRGNLRLHWLTNRNFPA